MIPIKELEVGQTVWRISTFPKKGIKLFIMPHRIISIGPKLICLTAWCDPGVCFYEPSVLFHWQQDAYTFATAGVPPEEIET